MTIFDWINQILVKKTHWNEFTMMNKRNFSPFIINRWLSMDKDFIEIVNFLSKVFHWNIRTTRRFINGIVICLPKGKRFNKYIKGKKER